eukprot:CAMPEP_0172310326 /NCGR_PEP_ID=MMETSP1058-20130122/11426_1 /TAXON_ID=83371 /ORGANISM="Detonula confervacea, Strain CCMP 353" /LENGTH=266 /DNA_ID=CAMNT_0013023121 /DNA_START=56 /DNA_END=856 /DNA_ORIENTATION=+
MHLRSYATPMATTALCTMLRHTAAFTPIARQAACLTSSPQPSSTSRVIHSLSRPPSASSPSSRPSRALSWSLFSTTEEIDPGPIEGTDLRVLKYPHPALRAPNEEIPMEELTGPGSEISEIAKEMFLVMYGTVGVGLAAPQVGINKRLMVYNESGDSKKWMQETVMVNPKIVEFSEAKDVDEEGCLSFPEMGGDVERSKWIKVEAQNLKGKKIKKKFKGWEARIFQHEYDHLDGIVYVDRLTEDGRKEVQPQLDEMIADFGEGGAI